jgi:ribosomal protein S17E
MVEQSRNSGVKKFDWSNITEQFEGHFKKAFTANKKVTNNF